MNKIRFFAFPIPWLSNLSWFAYGYCSFGGYCLLEGTRMPYFLRIWAQEAARKGAGLSPLPSGSVVACMPPTWRVRSNGVARDRYRHERLYRVPACRRRGPQLKAISLGGLLPTAVFIYPAKTMSYPACFYHPDPGDSPVQLKRLRIFFQTFSRKTHEHRKFIQKICSAQGFHV